MTPRSLRSPAVPGGATGLHFETVFSLWKGRGRTGPSHSWKRWSGKGSEWLMVAAVCVMSIQAGQKKKARQTWDIWNTTGLIHSCANLGWKSTLICSSPPSDAYKSNVSYHQEASDHYYYYALTQKGLQPHAISRLLPGSLIAIKNKKYSPSELGKKKETAYKQTLIPPTKT